MRRVVITGFGVVSPIGSGAEAIFNALGRGVNGIRPISRFDASGLELRHAGDVFLAVCVNCTYPERFEGEIALWIDLCEASAHHRER